MPVSIFSCHGFKCWLAFRGNWKHTDWMRHDRDGWLAGHLTHCFHLNWMSKLRTMITRFIKVVVAMVVCSVAFLSSCWLRGCFLKAFFSFPRVLQWAWWTFRCAGNGYLVKKDNVFHNFQYVNKSLGFFYQFSYIACIFIMFSDCLAVFLPCGFSGFLTRQ